MKRIISIIIILTVLCSCAVNCFAQESQDVFYTQPDEELLKAFEYTKELRDKEDKIYVEKYILKEGEEYDLEKMTHDTSKLYKFKNWTPNAFKELITSEDIRAEIRNFKPKCYIYPCYYDGKLIPYYREVLAWHEAEEDYDRDRYIVHNFGINDRLNFGIPEYSTKDEVEEYLQNAGIVGYDVIYSLHSCFMPFAITEKDGELFIIHLLQDSYMINESTVELCKKEKELIDKQVLTVEETCYLVDSFQEIANEITKENSLELDGTVSRSNDEPSSFPWGYVVISAVLIAVIAAVCITVVIKKKKI